MIVALILAITIIMCCFIISYFKFKTQELDYKKVEDEYAQKTIKGRTELEVEQERTKQRLLDREKEAEITKQLEIKSNYEKETGKKLYKF